MRHINRRKSLKPTSYIIISALTEANRLFESVIEKGGNLKAGSEAYESKAAEAEAMLDELALQDPEEATLIYKACPWYFDEQIDVNEVYLGKGFFIDRSMLDTLDSPAKREEYIQNN